jgi:Rrf2 family nitric oxide-sensitive transcriptional repressor
VGGGAALRLTACRFRGVRRAEVAMQINQFTNYALRILMYCAVHDDRAARTSDIARAYGISENHLTKVAQQLAAGGYLKTSRGRGGGLRLDRPAHEIVVGEVVRWTEGTLKLVECFDLETNTCPLAPACRFRQALSRALEAFFLVLDSYTLADLVSDRGGLAALLQPPEPSVVEG